MLFFKKKGSPEVVDLTDLQKRGLLRTPAPEKNEDGVVDFSSSRNVGGVRGAQSSSSSASPAGDFLSNLSGVGASSNSIGGVQDSPGPIISNLRSARQRSLDNAKLNELKLKVDDSDYKLNSLIERVRELEEKLRERGL